MKNHFLWTLFCKYRQSQFYKQNNAQKHTKNQLSDYSTPAASVSQDSEIATENIANLNKQYFDREKDPDTIRLNCKIDQKTSDRPHKNEKTELKQIKRRDLSDVMEGIFNK